MKRRPRVKGEVLSHSRCDCVKCSAILRRAKQDQSAGIADIASTDLIWDGGALWRVGPHVAGGCAPVDLGPVAATRDNAVAFAWLSRGEHVLTLRHVADLCSILRGQPREHIEQFIVGLDGALVNTGYLRRASTIKQHRDRLRRFRKAIENINGIAQDFRQGQGGFTLQQTFDDLGNDAAFWDGALDEWNAAAVHLARAYELTGAELDRIAGRGRRGIDKEALVNLDGAIESLWREHFGAPGGRGSTYDEVLTLVYKHVKGIGGDTRRHLPK